MKLHLNKNITEGINPKRRDLKENENNPNMEKKPKDVRALRQDVYDVFDDHEVFEDNAEEVNKEVTAQAKKAGMNPVNEDYTEEAYSASKCEEVLSKLTNGFSKESGSVETSWKEEKEHCVSCLRKHYNGIDVADGRRSEDEEMIWVISYYDPKD